MAVHPDWQKTRSFVRFRAAMYVKFVKFIVYCLMEITKKKTEVMYAKIYSYTRTRIIHKGIYYHAYCKCVSAMDDIIHKHTQTHRTYPFFCLICLDQHNQKRKVMIMTCL